jgi:hypothetical protein
MYLLSNYAKGVWLNLEIIFIYSNKQILLFYAHVNVKNVYLSLQNNIEGIEPTRTVDLWRI